MSNRNYEYCEFDVIYADLRLNGVHELADLPVLDLAADNCLIFLWAKANEMADATYLLEAWGFDYETIAFLYEDDFGDMEYCLMGGIGAYNSLLEQPGDFPISCDMDRDDLTKMAIREMTGGAHAVLLYDDRPYSSEWKTVDITSLM